MLFRGEAKYVRKQTREDENGYCVNPPLKLHVSKRLTCVTLAVALASQIIWRCLQKRLRRNFKALRCPSLIVLLRDVRYDLQISR